MATNETKKLPLEPRLPVVGGADYDQRLNRALYDILRPLTTRVNSIKDPGPPAAAFAGLRGNQMIYTAASLSIPDNYDLIDVYGTSNINYLTGGHDGSVVFLTFIQNPHFYVDGWDVALTPGSLVIAERIGATWHVRSVILGAASTSAAGAMAYKSVMLTMTAGSSAATITHSLGYAPSPAQIVINHVLLSAVAEQNQLYIYNVTSSIIELRRLAYTNEIRFYVGVIND